MRPVHGSIALVACALGGGSSAQSPCSPGWDDRFYPRGTSGAVSAQIVFDDGTGSALYAAGRFQSAGRVFATGIARFDGVQWSVLGGADDFGKGPDVLSLAIFDSGSGPQLHVAGRISMIVGSTVLQNICRWTGTSWAPLGGGLQFGGSRVDALLAYAESPGAPTMLYAAGSSMTSGGSGIARWDGIAWSGVGAGIPNGARALYAYDAGSGSRLYVGGSFGLLAWDGASWTELGTTTGGAVEALATWDDGSGLALYAAGGFASIGGVDAARIARWNGAQWTSVGTGLGAGSANALAVHDDGGGAELWVGGAFTTAGGLAANCVAAWDGSTWSAAAAGVESSLASGTASVESLCAFGSRLYAAGNFEASGSTVAANIAAWNGASWAATSDGEGVDGRVHQLEVFDDGAGPSLYATGLFRRIGALTTSNIARWDGTTWSALAGGAASAGAMCAHDDGSGGALYVAGVGIVDAAGAPIPVIARWRGGAWSAIGAGLAIQPLGSVSALAEHDEGAGARLFAIGNFAFVDPVHGPSNDLARWDGNAWTRVGNGTDFSAPVAEFASFDDGTGLALYVGGSFSSIAGVQCPSHVARWNGSAWTPVGNLLDGDVRTLSVFDAGSGPRLHAGGVFRFSGTGAPMDRLARLEGGAWVDGSTLGFNFRVMALRAFDDGAGPTLFAAGAFHDGIVRAAGPMSPSLAPAIRSFDIPDVWDAVALREHDDGASGGPDLYVGGSFLVAGGVGSTGLACWRGCRATATSLCTGEAGAGGACPCGNASAAGSGEGCAHSFGYGGLLGASGWASVSHDSVVLNGTRMTSSTCIYIQGTSSANGGAGTTFGDGLRCVAGSVVRLGTKVNAAGASHFPDGSDPRVSVRGAVPAGSTRTYQVWFRNAAPFCTGDTFNLTNAVAITWAG